MIDEKELDNVIEWIIAEIAKNDKRKNECIEGEKQHKIRNPDVKIAPEAFLTCMYDAKAYALREVLARLNPVMIKKEPDGRWGRIKIEEKSTKET